MNTYLLEKDSIDSCQCGFRAMHSYLTALTKITDDIDAFSKDSVDRDALYAKLKRMYCSEAYSLIFSGQIVGCQVLRVLQLQEVFAKDKADVQLYQSGCIHGFGAGVNMKSQNIMNENNADVETYGEGGNIDIKFVPDNGNDYIDESESSVERHI
uniref:Uncharacterized protein n=1 Tax=Glossina austeni TaxID=7395 RepID=A0A1A9VAT7_GLOAU